MAALPLQRIEGKYEILEKIREGGMGAIYKVRHRLLDEIRVVKLMRQQLVEDEELKARFLREARLAIKLRHPNIAQLYDFTVDDDGTAFIVMEFIDGMTLEDILAFHGPPPLGLALEIAQQSLRAVGYLHSKGLIHRDISPDNLMLTVDTEGQPLVKLIDLGIAKIQGVGGESHLTQTGTFLGKIRYAPPEQFGADGAATVDSRGDLYSFGVVLYELLTARFPIQGKDPSSLIAGHLFRPPLDFAETDPAGRIPAELRAVTFKALAKSPEERFATAAELSRALAVFRTPADVAEESLKEHLTRPFVRAGAASVADPGSTQERLDQNFDLAPTPSPGNLLHLAKTVTPTPARGKPADGSNAVREVPGTVELQPESRQLPTAESGLRRVTDADGPQPVAGTVRDAFAVALAEIEAALEERDYSAAESLLYGAESSFGERAELSSLYERIAEQRRQDLEEKKRQKELAGPIAAARELADRKDPNGALEALHRAAPPPEVRAAPSPRSMVPPAPARTVRWKLWAAVAAGVLLLIFTALFLSRHEKTSVAQAPSPASPTVSPSAGTTAAPGTLVLDAIPWGEVVEVVDGKGKQQALGPQKYTPLVLSLPPGHYTLILRNPDFPKLLSLSADVSTGAEVRSVAEFGAISEERFFKEMGW